MHRDSLMMCSIIFAAMLYNLSKCDNVPVACGPGPDILLTSGARILVRNCGCAPPSMVTVTTSPTDTLISNVSIIAINSFVNFWISTSHVQLVNVSVVWRDYSDESCGSNLMPADSSIFKVASNLDNVVSSNITIIVENCTHRRFVSSIGVASTASKLVDVGKSTLNNLTVRMKAVSLQLEAIDWHNTVGYVVAIDVAAMKHVSITLVDLSVVLHYSFVAASPDATRYYHGVYIVSDDCQGYTMIDLSRTVWQIHFEPTFNVTYLWGKVMVLVVDAIDLSKPHNHGPGCSDYHVLIRVVDSFFNVSCADRCEAVQIGAIPQNVTVEVSNASFVSSAHLPIMLSTRVGCFFRTDRSIRWLSLAFDGVQSVFHIVSGSTPGGVAASVEKIQFSVVELTDNLSDSSIFVTNCSTVGAFSGGTIDPDSYAVMFVPMRACIVALSKWIENVVVAIVDTSIAASFETRFSSEPAQVGWVSMGTSALEGLGRGINMTVTVMRVSVATTSVAVGNTQGRLQFTNQPVLWNYSVQTVAVLCCVPMDANDFASVNSLVLGIVKPRLAAIFSGNISETSIDIVNVSLSRPSPVQRGVALSAAILALEMTGSAIRFAGLRSDRLFLGDPQYSVLRQVTVDASDCHFAVRLVERFVSVASSSISLRNVTIARTGNDDPQGGQPEPNVAILASLTSVPQTAFHVSSSSFSGFRLLMNQSNDATGMLGVSFRLGCNRIREWPGGSSSSTVIDDVKYHALTKGEVGINISQIVEDGNETRIDGISCVAEAKGAAPATRKPLTKVNAVFLGSVISSFFSAQVQSGLGTATSGQRALASLKLAVTCGDSGAQDGGDVEIGLADSPTQLSLASSTPDNGGVVVGNMLLYLGFALAYGLLGFMISRRDLSKRGGVRLIERVYWEAALPGSIAWVMGILFQPTVTYAAMLLQEASLTSCAIGIIGGGAALALVLYSGIRIVWNGSNGLEVAPKPQRSGQRQSRLELIRHFWFSRRWQWHLSSSVSRERSAQLTQILHFHEPLVVDYCNVWYSSFEYGSSFVTGIVSAAPAIIDGGDACGPSLWILFGWNCALLLVLAAVRPYHSYFGNALQLYNSTTAMIVALLAALKIADATATLSLFTTYLGMVMSACGFLMHVRESILWRMLTRLGVFGGEPAQSDGISTLGALSLGTSNQRKIAFAGRSDADHGRSNDGFVLAHPSERGGYVKVDLQSVLVSAQGEDAQLLRAVLRTAGTLDERLRVLVEVACGKSCPATRD